MIDSSMKRQDWRVRVRWLSRLLEFVESLGSLVYGSSSIR